MALIATSLVISLVIGQSVQQANGQSAATSTGGGGGVPTTTSSSSISARGVKRAGQQRPTAQQQVANALDQDQQQRQASPVNGMAPFYSIKDGKTSARRIQLQRNATAAARDDGQQQRQDAPADARPDMQSWPQAGGEMAEAGQDSNVRNNNAGPKTLMSDAGSTDAGEAGERAKPTAEFNQLAPMSGDQQLANMMAISSFNQLVGSSGANQLGDFKSAAGESAFAAASGGADENADDKQRKIQVAARDGFAPSAGQASFSGELVPGNKAQAAGENGPTDSRPIKQSNRAATKQARKQSQKLSKSQSPIRQQRPPQDQQAFAGGSSAAGQQQQQQSSTLSMNLDGTMVSSRPRTNSIGEQQPSAGKSNQKSSRNKSAGNNRSNQVSRQQQVAGAQSPPPTTTPASAFNADSGAQGGQQQPAAGNGRRVQFSGVPFSSPASKGQRTKPKASNQIGGFAGGAAASGQPNSINGQPASNDARASQFESGMSRVVGDNSRGERQQFGAAAGDQQQKVLATNLEADQQVNPAGANEELINSVMLSLNNMAAADNNDQQRQADSQPGDANQPQRFNQVETSKLPNGDMLMSVISSDDGRERKLVMISRDTLDSLQRFADQQQQQQQQEQPQLQLVQQKVSDSEAGAGSSGWWPATTTIKPILSSQFEQPTTATTQASRQRDQTATTFMPVSFSTSVAITRTPPADGFGASTTLLTNEDESISRGGSSGDSGANTFREVSTKQTNVTNEPANRSEAQAAVAEARPSQAARQNRVKQQQVSGAKTGRARSKQTLVANGAAPATGGSDSGRLQKINRQQVLVADGQAEPATTQRSASFVESSSPPIGGLSTGDESQPTRPADNVGTAPPSTKSRLTKKTQQGAQPKSSGRKQEQASAATTTTTSASVTSGPSNQKRTKSGKTQKSGSSQAKQSSSVKSGKSQAARKQTNASGDGSAVTSGSQQQQQSPAATTTQAPSAGVEAGATNGQQLPRGRLPAAQPGADQDIPNEARPAVETIETNRRQNASSSPSPAGGEANSPAPAKSEGAPDRAELDRQLDEMERAQEIASSQATGNQLDSERVRGGASVGELDGLRAAIPGEPLADYPIYSEPPARSSFQCQAQSCPGGYYADLDAQCQVFHVCQNDGRMDTFLCPNGTIFSQQHFVCVWWWQVDCSQSLSFYKLNDAIYCNSMMLPALAAEVQPDAMSSFDEDSRAPSAGSNTNQLSASSGASDAPLPQPPRRQPAAQGASRQRVSGPQRTNTMTNSAQSSATSTELDGPSTSTQSPNFTNKPKALSSTTTSSSSNRQQSGGNQLEPASAGTTPINAPEGQVSNRNQSAPGDSVNESDMNQQQQQQLELLSRKAA